MGIMDQSLQPKTSSSQHSKAEAVVLLLTNIEGYFGAQYNQVQKRLIVAYFMALDPRDYDAIYAETLKVKLYGRALPLIEHFEQAVESVKSNRPEYPEWIVPQIDAETSMARLDMAEELNKLLEGLCKKRYI